jgi:hypothetical protein
MKRDWYLKRAADLINGDRAKDYGDAYDNHQRVATMWSAILGIKVSVRMVYLCLIALKISRLVKSPDHVDQLCFNQIYFASFTNNKIIFLVIFTFHDTLSLLCYAAYIL